MERGKWKKRMQEEGIGLDNLRFQYLEKVRQRIEASGGSYDAWINNDKYFNSIFRWSPPSP